MDRADLAPGGLEARPGPEARRNEEEATPLEIARPNDERNPELLLPHPSEAQRHEVGRHDADDGDRHAIQPDRLADDRRVGAEAAGPEPVADDDLAGVGGQPGGEAGAEQWSAAKEREQAG